MDLRSHLPLISVVTPSFNQGEYLEECIDSILSQGYPRLEYIIMDGGSTDNSAEIIKRYSKYLTYWQSKPDGGQYNAINEGFKRTSGEIMAWLNSDDKYHHNAFFKVAYIFMHSDDVEWLTGRHTFWDKDGNVKDIADRLPQHSRRKFLEKQYDDPWVQQESTFWKRSLWEKAGSSLAVGLEYAGDLELWLRFSRFAPLYAIDALLAGYRMHGNQKAALFFDRYKEEADRVIEEEISFCAQGLFKGMLPSPEPLAIPLVDFRRFRRGCLTMTLGEGPGLADEAEILCEYLLRSLTK